MPAQVHVTSHQDPRMVTIEATQHDLLTESIDDLEVLAELMHSETEVMLTDLPARIVERCRQRLMAIRGDR